MIDLTDEQKESIWQAVYRTAVQHTMEREEFFQVVHETLNPPAEEPAYRYVYVGEALEADDQYYSERLDKWVPMWDSEVGHPVDFDSERRYRRRTRPPRPAPSPGPGYRYLEVGECTQWCDQQFDYATSTWKNVPIPYCHDTIVYDGDQYVYRRPVVDLVP